MMVAAHMPRAARNIMPPKDAATSAARNRERAEGGDKLAQSRLGRRYLEGDGVERDELEAKRWLRAATEQGDRPARELLADLQLRNPSRASDSYEEELGRGLQLLFAKELELATRAFHRACTLAPSDDPSAFYNLGCVLALQGRVEDAVSALTDAVARGMTYQELTEDPDRKAMFGSDERYDQVWLHAEQLARTAGLERRAQKMHARAVAQAEAELAAAAKLEAARDHEAEARAAVAGTEAADSMYLMKGLGDRPLLYATILSYHEAELRLTEALRQPAIARDVGLARELDSVSK